MEVLGLLLCFLVYFVENNNSGTSIIPLVNTEWAEAPAESAKGTNSIEMLSI